MSLHGDDSHRRDESSESPALTRSFQELVESNERAAKLAVWAGQLATNTIFVVAKTISKERPLGRLPAFDEYKLKVPLAAKSLVANFARDYEEMARCVIEKQFLVNCLRDEVVPDNFRLKIWAGLSRHTCAFDAQWEIKAHAISLKLMKAVIGAHQSSIVEFKKKINDTKGRLEHKIQMSEVNALDDFFAKWLKQVRETPEQRMRSAALAKSYGTTTAQHRKARGNQPLANQSARNRDQAYALQQQPGAAGRAAGTQTAAGRTNVYRTPGVMSEEEFGQLVNRK